MSQEFPNTVLMWESTRDEGSRFEKIFEPDVKVLLSWRDVEAAVEVGAVVPSEAYALWAYWAAPSSPARLAAQAVLQSQPDAKPEPMAPKASESGFTAAAPASRLVGGSHEPLEMKVPGQGHQRKGLPAVLRTLLAVVLVGLVVWAAGKVLGVWSM